MGNGLNFDEGDIETLEQFSRSLTNQPPTDEQIVRIEEVRGAAKVFLNSIVRNAHYSRERSLALTHLEESVMWAVKSIVLE